MCFVTFVEADVTTSGFRSTRLSVWSVMCSKEGSVQYLNPVLMSESVHGKMTRSEKAEAHSSTTNCVFNFNYYRLLIVGIWFSIDRWKTYFS